MTLADAITAVHEERGPLPAGEVAVAVRKRKADVLNVYRANPQRFVHTGKTKASRWNVRKPSFDTLEAAARWGCDTEIAAEIIFGPEGFLERGFVSSLNGNGRVVVTELGRMVAATVEAAREAA